MEAGSYISLSLATAMRRDLEVTANNIANVNTAGFKSERIVFESYMETAGNGEQTEFVVDVGSYVDTRQGPLSHTGNPLDIAMNGQGWMSYRTPEGHVAYGRDGQLVISSEGYLQTVSGARVLDSGGAEITLPPNLSNVKISPDGTISSDDGPLGQIGMFDLPSIQSYVREGSGMFRPSDGDANDVTPARNTEIVQGSIESSNVQAISEVTRLVEVQNAYRRANSLIENEDGLLRDSLRRLGRMS